MGPLSLTSGSSLLSRPRALFPRCGSSSSVDTWSSFGGGGILAGDNHNSLYTRATMFSPSSCPLRCPLRFPPLSSFRLDSPFSLPSSLSLSFLITSSPCRSSPLSPDHPVVSTMAIPQLFSTFLALVAARRRISHAFRYHVLCWSFFPLFSFSSPPPSLSLSFLTIFFIPFFPLLSGIYFSSRRTFLRTFAFPPALSFILEMGIGIHETKLMITTSKQRTERPTATLVEIYINSICLLHSSFISHRVPARSLISFLSLSRCPSILHNVFSFAEVSFISIVSYMF